MPGNITDLHKLLTSNIIQTVPDAREHSFWAAHDELCAAIDIERGFSLPFRPDAFRINHETSEIEIYEIEVRSKLSAPKIEMLGALWQWWDGEEVDWLPVLFVVDRFGNMNRMELGDAASDNGWSTRARFGAEPA